MREVYLIGVNHMYQFVPDGRIVRFGPPAIFAQFRQFLTETIAAHGIRGIAEEMSRAALRKHSISGDSVPCRLAAELGLPHRYCDPEPEIQKRLSIVSDEQREKCWIQELMSLDVFPVLFVLGAAHIDSFQVLLRARGLAPVIVARDWQPPPDGTQAV